MNTIDTMDLVILIAVVGIIVILTLLIVDTMQKICGVEEEEHRVIATMANWLL